MGLSSWISSLKKDKTNFLEAIISNNIKEIWFKELALYTAISLIANSIAKCEIKTYKNNEEVKELDYFAFNYSPNANENASLFWHKVIDQMFNNTDGALVIPGKEHGTIYCADSYTVEKHPFDEHIYTNIQIDGESFGRNLKASKVYLFKNENENVKRLINGVFEQYTEVLNCAIGSYKKANGSKYKLEIEAGKIGDKKFLEEYKTVISKEIKKYVENDTAVYPEFKGYTLSEMKREGNIMKDAKDIKDIRKDMFEIVGDSLHIPQSLMTGNVTNINDVANTFITFGVEPITSMLGREMTRKDGYNSFKSGNYVHVDTMAINHIDLLNMANAVDKLISSGVTCVDEIRDVLKFARLNTEFSKTHFITKNFDTAENRLKGGEGN